MKLMEGLATRRAVRDFTSDRVSRNVLNELVEAATWSPSYMNLQPWAFVATNDPRAVVRFGEAARKYLVRTLSKQPEFKDQGDEIAASHYRMFYNAPALIVVCATRNDSLTDTGCAMAAQNLMLAAHAMGLGSCLVSQALPWLNSPAGRKMLVIPRGQRAVAPVIVGCPHGEPLSPGRFEPVVQWAPSPES